MNTEPLRRPPQGEGAGRNPPLALDQDRFDHLMQVAGAHAEDLLRQLLIDLEQVHAQLLATAEAPDPGVVRAQAHVLVALAGATGAGKVQDLAQALNATAHHQSGPELRAAVAGVLGPLEALLAFLAARLDGMGG
ncbi:MAG: hypothetical protein ACK4S2_06670 [Gemmobacter sp.]|uniref:hypothetical protein n=1 Tax=Gemmobacter sp. TaxID=1898957 RepID=UPI0039194D27